MVIADHVHPVAALFGRGGAALAPTPSSERIVIAAVQAKGIPDLSAEEALWTAIEILREER